MRKKEICLLILLGALTIGLLVGYFAVVRPLTREGEETETVYVPETEAGEGVGLANKILVYPAVETLDIQSVEVRNSYGHFRLHRNESGDVVIDGYEDLLIHKENVASLLASCGYPLVLAKVGRTEDLAEYGLAETTDAEGVTHRPASYVMTTKDARQYTCYIGNPIVTGTGYYFLYADRPDTVYALDNTVGDVLLKPVEALVKPMLVEPMSQNDYFEVHDFILRKGEETVIALDYIEEEERADTELVTRTYRMLSLPELIPSAEAVSQAMYGLLTAEENKACETVELGLSDRVLEKYHLKDGCYSLRYTYQGKENFVLISPRGEDGSYYAASPTFRQVVKVDGATFDFLTWDLFRWIESPIFQYKIEFIHDITVRSGDYHVTFLLEGDGKDLVVTEKETGNRPDVTNFRQFYKTLLYASYEGESGLTSEEQAMYNAMGDAECQLVLTIHTEAGTELVYRFFRYSERRSYLSLNGRGEFYILRTMGDKIVADAKRVQAGETVVSTGKY